MAGTVLGTRRGAARRPGAGLWGGRGGAGPPGTGGPERGGGGGGGWRGAGGGGRRRGAGGVGGAGGGLGGGRDARVGGGPAGQVGIELDDVRAGLGQHVQRGVRGAEPGEADEVAGRAQPAECGGDRGPLRRGEAAAQADDDLVRPPAGVAQPVVQGGQGRLAVRDGL